MNDEKTNERKVSQKVPQSESGTVLITGAGRRIGRALALAFAEWGWRVGVHYCASAEGANETVALIRARGGVAEAFGADLTRLDEVGNLVPRCREALGDVGCLVNNASEFLEDTIATLAPEQWQLHMDLNLRAPVFLAKAFAAALPEGAMGNIVNILDQRVCRPTPYFFSYTISKAGLWAATQTLAQALSPRIRVNAIGPGPVLPSIYQTEEQFARQCAATPLGRGTSPEEIARAIRFVLDAPALTGQIVLLDGGQHLAWKTRDVMVEGPAATGERTDARNSSATRSDT